MNSFSAEFLNLDLEIDGDDDLSPLADYLKRSACILYNGPTEKGFRLSLEPLIDGELSIDPVACTECFLSLLEGLPLNLQTMWCSSYRVLDYGFDGGLEHPPMHIDLPAPLLGRIAKLGLNLRITVYPYRDGMEDDS